RPVAAAARAGRDVDHLAEHRLADRSDLAAAVALGAGRRARPGLRAGPAARLAASQDRELDLLLGSEDRVFERDPQVVTEVDAARRSTTAAGRRGAAEERVEDVGEAAETGCRVSDLSRAEEVVALAALGLGEDLVR